ncbi:amidase [Haliangium sp.]|uniref:amidase n=1 Tax=Haliangium sp. TaxID=2663208 RepID=UPI003D1330C8
MSTFAEYTHYDGLGLAELVRTKQVSPAELVEAAIERIEAVNPRLNAVIHAMYDQAREAVAQGVPDGPFVGVPCLLKDLLAACAGVPMRGGSRALEGFVPERDSELVRRYKAAGLVIVGKTNTPELGLAPVTEPQVFGPTHNPWDPSRSPAGSSGGSAAAVAARMVPLAGGSDGGGSIRMPASACSVFGLKPSRGRMPVGPERSEVWHGLVSEHMLTRSVRDCAAALDVAAGPEPGAPYLAPPPARPFLDEVGADPGSLRIAYSTQSLLGSQVDRDCVAGVEQTAALLTELGHTVEEAAPNLDRAEFMRAYLGTVSVDLATDLDELSALLGRKVADEVEPATRALALIGQTTRALDFEASLRTLHRVSRQVGGFFERYDLLLTPTMPRPPIKTGALSPNVVERTLLRAVGTLRAGSIMQRIGMVDQMAAKLFEFMSFTPLFNVTGQPAMSVPGVWNQDGLPIGMHFAARMAEEATLLRLAAQLEQARPWADRRPQVSAS